MYTVWTDHLNTDDEKNHFKNSLRNCSAGFDRLKDILKQENKEAEGIELKEVAYSNPNWDYLQAHRNGYRSCLKEIIDLIESLDRKIDIIS